MSSALFLLSLIIILLVAGLGMIIGVKTICVRGLGIVLIIGGAVTLFIACLYPKDGGNDDLTFIKYNAADQIMLLNDNGLVYLVNPDKVQSWSHLDAEPGYHSVWLGWRFVEEPSPMKILGARRGDYNNDDVEGIVMAIASDLPVVGRPLVIEVEVQQLGGVELAELSSYPDNYLWLPYPAPAAEGFSIRERIENGSLETTE